MSAQSKPVAWRYRWRGDEHDEQSAWEAVMTEEKLPRFRKGWDVEPLYAAPNPDQSVIDMLTIALTNARARIVYLGDLYGNERHRTSNERDFLPEIDAALSAVS